MPSIAARMLQGLSATALYFHLGTADWGGQQPSDLDGSTLPTRWRA